MDGDEFRGLIRRYMEIRHIKRLEDIRQHTTLSTGTFSKYWNHPGLFPVDQMIMIFDYLKIPYEERKIILMRGNPV